MFMLISDLHSSTVIGCGGGLNQLEWGTEGAEGMEGTECWGVEGPNCP